MSIFIVIGNHINFSVKDWETSIKAKVIKLSSEEGKRTEHSFPHTNSAEAKFMTESPSFLS